MTSVFSALLGSTTCGSQLNHDVLTVGHDRVLTATCGTVLDHRVLAVGRSTVVCSQLRVERSLFNAFRHDWGRGAS